MSSHQGIYPVKSEYIEDPKKGRYDVRLINADNGASEYRALRRAFKRLVTQMSVEFLLLPSSDEKPHLTFRFNFVKPFRIHQSDLLPSDSDQSDSDWSDSGRSDSPRSGIPERDIPQSNIPQSDNPQSHAPEYIIYRSFRLSMDLSGGKDGSQGAGACVITFSESNTRSEKAAAAFEFEMKKKLTLQDLLQVINGSHNSLENYRSMEWYPCLKHDLGIFQFVAVLPPGNSYASDDPWDGCRDWV